MPTPLRTVATIFALLCTVGAAPGEDVPLPGTVLSGKIDQTIDSRMADPLEPFTISAVASDDRSITGGKVFGHITKVVKSDQHRPGLVVLTIDAFITSTGRRVPLQASPVAISVDTKTHAGKDAFGAVGGVLDPAGHGAMPLTPAAGPAGAAPGAALTARRSRTDVIIPSHATIQLEVTSTLTAR
jgi:hypothetical protein